ncbi:MAG: serine/threonine-protein kinase, partial [Steroidobacteraceae bacterium]
MSETNKLATQWRSISELLDEALLLPASERGRWLAELPLEQLHLRETLRHFLELHARIDGEGFLEIPAHASIDAATAMPILSPGDSVGPYRILAEIGAGGMGSVWLAERGDGKPRRRVALKLPRMVWASDLSERLERERDILASLEHPNIARLYDAGLDAQARPYLAIEYVEGLRITDYCREQQLDPRRRIELFLQVLAAVQYAHTRLVLHRDLKPSNILVNRSGDVRLLDFGIAKLVEDGPAETSPDQITASRALTPRYASPEQLRGERLTLVSDVYSLGVILYELLTELSPYPASAKSRVELEIAVMEGALTPPSRRVASVAGSGDLQLTGLRLSRILRGDLDAIVLKSLALDVHSRYASVEAFAADLRRWLEGQPVLASAPSTFVIVRKFVMRNRAAVSIAAVATLAILVMSGVAVFQANKANAESQRAAATRDFLIDMFESANPELRGGREATVGEL